MIRSRDLVSETGTWPPVFSLIIARWNTNIKYKLAWYSVITIVSLWSCHKKNPPEGAILTAARINQWNWLSQQLSVLWQLAMHSLSDVFWLADACYLQNGSWIQFFAQSKKACHGFNCQTDNISNFHSRLFFRSRDNIVQTNCPEKDLGDW